MPRNGTERTLLLHRLTYGKRTLVSVHSKRQGAPSYALFRTFRYQLQACLKSPRAGFLFLTPCACEPNGHVFIVLVEDHRSSAWPIAASAEEGMTMATNKKDGSSQPSRSRKQPQKSASKSTSRSAAKRGNAAPKRAQPKAMTGPRSATKSQTIPTKSRSSAGSRTAARATSGASRSRSTAPARSASRSRSQASLMNPMAWLSTLETTLTSPQARAVMAEALRAVASVLEKPQRGEQGQSSGLRPGRDAVSAAGSLGAEIVAAPLEVAAAAIGAAGDVVTSALGGSSGEDRGTSEGKKGSRRSSSHRRSSAAGD